IPVGVHSEMAPYLVPYVLRPLPKTNLLHFAFHASTNQQRPGIITTLLKNGFTCTQEHNDVADYTKRMKCVDRAKYVSNLAASAFCACPAGIENDTFRFWEALYCGAIPVVGSNPVAAYWAQFAPV